MTLNYPSRTHASHQRVSNPPTRDVNAATRAATALKHRAARLTYEEIAHLTGYNSASSARKAIMREMDRVVVKSVDELRTQELHMLDVMHQEVWELFMNKQNKGRLFAADRILAISERRARLMGLDVRPDELPANLVVVREIPQGYLAEANGHMPVEVTP